MIHKYTSLSDELKVQDIRILNKFLEVFVIYSYILFQKFKIAHPYIHFRQVQRLTAGNGLFNKRLLIICLALKISNYISSNKKGKSEKIRTYLSDVS